MKKKIIGAAVGVVAIICIVAFWQLFLPANLSVNETAEVHVTFNHDDNNVYEQLSDEDSKNISKMFNGKELIYDDGISCGFGNVELKIDGKTFYPACDTCGTIKYNLKIFNLTNAETKTLHKILSKYGVRFPCI